MKQSKQLKKYYNQTEIADLLGVSKATISRYIKKLNVSGIEENKAKMYPETVLKQLRKEIKQDNSKKNTPPSTIQLLQDQIQQLKEENKRLYQQLEKKDEQIAIKDNQIKTANKLADQAQYLNALDKPKLKEPKKKKHWWQHKKE